MPWSFWIGIAIALFIVEILSPGVFFFACLGLGSLFAGLIVLLNPPFWAQWVVFIVVSFLSIYFIRPIARRFFQPKSSKRTNVDALVGQIALVTEAVNPPNLGMVKVDGELWRAETDEKIDVGAEVEVLEIKGSHLKIKKLK